MKQVNIQHINLMRAKVELPPVDEETLLRKMLPRCKQGEHRICFGFEFDDNLDAKKCACICHTID